jgi:hypothetical protein
MRVFAVTDFRARLYLLENNCLGWLRRDVSQKQKASAGFRQIRVTETVTGNVIFQ